jgi:hypothetical protein
MSAFGYFARIEVRKFIAAITPKADITGVAL